MIYFVRAGEDGPVKIGVSTNAAKRIDALKTASPIKLSVLRVIEGDRLQEQALHWEFRNLRLQGEWFRFDPRMLEVDPDTIVVGEHEPPMPNKRFSECLEIIGWSARYLSELLRCDTNLPTRWKRGRTQVPAEVSEWLETLATEHQRLAVPNNWRVRATHPVP